MGSFAPRRQAFRRGHPVRLAPVLVLLALIWPGAGQAQTRTPGAAGTPGTASPSVSTRATAAKAVRAKRPAAALPVDKMNTWTVGLAGGLLEGAPIRLAAEIARVVDDGDNLRVLPVVTRGATENVQSLLRLQGIDAAIINADALEEFRTSVPQIDRKVALLLSLFPSEVHIFVRPEIKSLQDLAGKKVNFNTVGTAAAYTGPIILGRLGVKVDQQFIPHQTALEQLRSGEMAGVVFVTSKPVDAFLKGRWEPGFKFLNVEYGETLADYYLPVFLEASDYPNLITPGERVRTIAVPTVLVSYNWPANSDRYRRVARLTEYLFTRIEALQAPGFHPKWKDVNLAASAGRMERFPAAREWLAKYAGDRPSARAALVEDVSRLPTATGSTGPDEKLFQEFLEWRKRRR